MKIRGDTYDKGSSLGDVGRSPRRGKATRLRSSTVKLSNAEKAAFLALAGPPSPPSWERPRVGWWQDTARESLLRDFVEDGELLRLDPDNRARVLDLLTISRFHAWGTDETTRTLKSERLRLKALKKVPGFRPALRAYRAVLGLFGEVPFPVSPRFRWSGMKMTAHDEMVTHAWGFLDATMRDFPAIGLYFPEFYTGMLSHDSTVPKGAAMKSLRKGLRHFGFSRENVSRLLYVVRLVPKLTGNL